MKPRLFLIPVLLLAPFLTPAQEEPTEAQVRQKIQQAQANVNNARQLVQQAGTALQNQVTQLEQLKQQWRRIRDDIAFLQQKLESANNSLTASVAHQDNELNRYKQKLQRLLQRNGSAEEIAECRRYIRAYENWKATRLRKNGLTAWKAGIERYLAQKQAELASLRPQAQASINNKKAAEQQLNEANAALQQEEEKLQQLLIDAPNMLNHISPPYLQKVMVKKGGSTRYAAEWDDYTKLVDEQIRVVQLGIEEQKSIIEAQIKLIQVTGDDLLQQNRLAQEKLDAYVAEVQGWGVTKVIMADLLDAGISIARNFKEMGPYAFAYEAVYRVGEAGLWAAGVTGPINADWDVTKLPTQPNAPVDISSYAAGYGMANLKDQIKGQIQNVLKSYLGASEFGIPGKAATFGTESTIGNFTSSRGLRDKWNGMRNLLKEGKFWVICDEALNEKWLAPITEGRNSGNFRDVMNTLKRSPRQFLQNLKSSFNKDMLKGALKDVVQTTFIQSLKNWANETRLEKWSDYLVEDLKREELKNILTTAGNKRRFQQQTLQALNEVLLALVREKEQQAQKATRFLKPLEDDVLSGTGNFTLVLEFSAPVVTDSVVLGGKRIEGQADGNTWTGSFDLTGISEDDLAQLVVAAKGATTQKDLDNPVTAAVFQSTSQSWSGYERTADRYHKIKLKSLRRGTSILLLVDCSGSMKDNDRMKKAKAAVERVLSSTQFEPTDEVALMAFYSCTSIPVLQPFTNNLDEVKAKLDQLSPSSGTPLSSAIISASYYLESTARTAFRKLIVITDGEESCGGNEFETMQRVSQFHHDIKRTIL